MKKSLAPVLVLLLAGGSLQGQVSSPATPAPVSPAVAAAGGPTDADLLTADKQSDYNLIVSRFFDAVKVGKYNDAAHIIVDTNKQDSFVVEKHEAVAVPLSKITDNFGAFQEFKPLVSKTIGDEIGYVYGVGVYQKNLVRYEFIFFKSDGYWRMLHLDFNVNFIDEIRGEAGVHIPTPPVVVQQPQNGSVAAPAPVAPAPSH